MKLQLILLALSLSTSVAVHAAASWNANNGNCSFQCLSQTKNGVPSPGASTYNYSTASAADCNAKATEECGDYDVANIRYTSGPQFETATPILISGLDGGKAEYKNGVCRVTCLDNPGETEMKPTASNDACVDFAISHCGRGNYSVRYSDGNDPQGNPQEAEAVLKTNDQILSID